MAGRKNTVGTTYRGKHSKEKTPEQKRLNAILGIAVIVCVIVVLAVLIIITIQHRKATERPQDTSLNSTANLEKWQEGVIEYKGKHYQYNSNIQTYLFLGVDNDNPVSPQKGGINGGQSDAIFLLVEDSKNEIVSTIAINRNVMTDVKTCDVNGDYDQTMKLQLCLAHGYGDGMESSCRNSVDAVSTLFYNIPITGYVALNMGGVPTLNDCVGGVEVTVMDDLSNPGRGVELHKGDTVTLNGDEAYTYIRSRDTTVFDSSSERLERQKQYIDAMVPKMQSMLQSGQLTAEGLSASVSDYLVTNVDFVKLISRAVDYGFDEHGFYTVPGETQMGDHYEEFYVDATAFYEMILQVFYVEVDE